MAELNFNAALYHPMQPEDEPSEYVVWLELCKRMDMELTEARNQWRISVRDRDETFAAMKAHTDRMRDRYKKLEARPKPPAPKKA